MQINKQQRQNLITYSLIKTMPRLKGQSDIALVLTRLLLPEFPRLPSGGSLSSLLDAGVQSLQCWDLCSRLQRGPWSLL